MRPLRKIFEALGHLNIFGNIIKKTECSTSAEHNMTFLLAENMFTHYYSLLLRQYSVLYGVNLLKTKSRLI